jgi:multiple antibiotic resistance protein
MTDLNALFKIGMTLFAIVNPIGSIPVFITATSESSQTERKNIVRMITITVFLVLVSAVLLGDKILAFFGISIPSFQTGGGILLLLMSISMMHAKQSDIRQTKEESEAIAERQAIAIVPLSIPLLAGPGAISNMIIAAQQSGNLWNHFQLLIPVFVVAVASGMILRMSVPIAHRLGTIGINVFTRLMGLILAAMSVEFIAHGMIGLFPVLGLKIS